MLPEYHTLGFKEYEKELTNDGKFGRVTLYDKILTCIVVPIFMIIIILMYSDSYDDLKKVIR